MVWLREVKSVLEHNQGVVESKLDRDEDVTEVENAYILECII
jgi:hypothetical protein